MYTHIYTCLDFYYWLLFFLSISLLSLLLLRFSLGFFRFYFVNYNLTQYTIWIPIKIHKHTLLSQTHKLFIHMYVWRLCSYFSQLEILLLNLCILMMIFSFIYYTICVRMCLRHNRLKRWKFQITTTNTKTNWHKNHNFSTSNFKK